MRYKQNFNINVEAYDNISEETTLNSMNKETFHLLWQGILFKIREREMLY